MVSDPMKDLIEAVEEIDSDPLKDSYDFYVVSSRQDRAKPEVIRYQGPCEEDSLLELGEFKKRGVLVTHTSYKFEPAQNRVTIVRGDWDGVRSNGETSTRMSYDQAAVISVIYQHLEARGSAATSE